MTRITVLANSRKNQDWCLAGIEEATGKWIRPVTTLDDGRIRQCDMKLDGYFPRILDILDIPLNSTGPDFGFESENRTILPGPWHLHERASPNDVFRHITRSGYILHNHKKYVTVEEMKQKPFPERTTLQLVRVNDFTVQDARNPNTEKHDWKGFVSSGGRVLDLNITDPAFCERLNGGCQPSRSCLLTMSLSMPYKPPNWGQDEPAPCWKLIAGVVEI